MKPSPAETNTNDALLAGATGLIGHELARLWAASVPAPARLHLLVRRPLAAGPRQAVHVVDFGQLPRLPRAGSACCCLGTTIKAAGSQEAFRAVDQHAVLAFARAARAAGVSRFAVVSALGADPHSRTFYNRVKGEMEADLATVGFASLVIARPSLLAGNRAALDQPLRAGERLALAVTAPLTALIPKAWRPIQAATVARALLRALAEAAPGVRVLESAALQDLGA
jgi:uncharacterized protein YbjT (DUF2867 family)